MARIEIEFVGESIDDEIIIDTEMWLNKWLRERVLHKSEGKMNITLYTVLDNTVSSPVEYVDINPQLERSGY